MPGPTGAYRTAMTQPAPKTGILLAAFGASGTSGGQAISVFERRVKAAFPHVAVRWAFTSAHMRTRLAEAKVKTDSVHKALSRMSFEKYTHVAVQSLHLIAGVEYESLLEEVERVAGEYPLRITVGTPLLYTDEDVRRAASALMASLPPERRRDEAVVCMGHGTWHQGASRYEDLARALAERDTGIFIGTLEGEHTIEHMSPALAAFGPKKAWLLPLLAVVGKHARTDMAGEQPHSWRSLITRLGIPCVPVLKGTVEYPEFADIWIAHLHKAIKRLS